MSTDSFERLIIVSDPESIKRLKQIGQKDPIRRIRPVEIKKTPDSVIKKILQEY